MAMMARPGRFTQLQAERGLAPRKYDIDDGSDTDEIEEEQEQGKQGFGVPARLNFDGKEGRTFYRWSNNTGDRPQAQLGPFQTPQSPQGTISQAQQAPKVTVSELASYEVVHERVVVRALPSTTAQALAVVRKGYVLPARHVDLEGMSWLHLEWPTINDLGCAAPTPEVKERGGWLLMDGSSLGLGTLAKRCKDNRKGDGKYTCRVCGARAETTKDKAAHERDTGHSGFMFGGAADT